jgi:AbrB family looped-hinge helix DNA binding protein
MKVSAKGQVTVPREIRERLGFLPGTEVDVTVRDGEVRIKRARSDRSASRGEEVIERLRRSASHLTMTTDELMELTRGE